MENLGNAPRNSGCWVCRNVASPEDVTVRLIDDQGDSLPPADAITYLTGIGHTATRRTWGQRLKRHVEHVRRSMAGGVITPAHRELERVAPIAPRGGAPTWVRAPERAMDLGLAAMETLAGRLEGLDDEQLVNVARLGVSAAGKVGDWHAKGRQMGQIDDLMAAIYASGESDDA